jgi:hypothetical protein
VDEPFDKPVGVGILPWMEVVDVTGKAHSAVILESEVGRKPLVGARPILPVDSVAIRVDLVISPDGSCELRLWYNFTLAGPLVDSVGNPDDLFLDELGLGYNLGQSEGQKQTWGYIYIPYTKGYMEGWTRSCTMSSLPGCQSGSAAWSARSFSKAALRPCRSSLLTRESAFMTVFNVGDWEEVCDELRVKIRPLSLK